MISTIKTMAFALAIAALSAVSVNAQDATMWKIDKSHTSVNFSINHFFSSVPGKFTGFDGTIHFDPNNLKGSKAEISVSINSLNTDDTKRDEHVKSKDFFNADAYPKMSFN